MNFLKTWKQAATSGKKMSSLPKLLIAITVCLTAGFLGSLFTAPAIDTWYAGLNKPWFNPPDFLFAQVWTGLYILMGVAVWLVWKKGLQTEKTKEALILFEAQLLLNTVWSIIFFGLREPLLAFVEIIFLWLFIWFTMRAFFKVSRVAGVLLIPYLAWVSFAAVLNFSIFLLNL